MFSVPQAYCGQILEHCKMAESQYLTDPNAPDYLVVPLVRPLEQVVPTDPVPPMFQPFPTVELKRYRSGPHNIYKLNSEVQNLENNS